MSKINWVNSTVLYPATGIAVIALETAKQSCPQNRQLSGYLVKEVSLPSPIVVGRTWEESTETMIELRRENLLEFDVRITALTDSRWIGCINVEELV